MIQPRLTNRLELPTKPAADHIHGNTRIRQMTDRRNLFRSQRGIPRSGQQGGDDFQFFSRAEQCLREADRLMLIICTVSGRKTYLGQRIVKTGFFRDLCQLAVIVKIPASTLGNVTDHQPARNVRHPVSKLYWLMTHRSLLSWRCCFSPDGGRRRSFHQMDRY
ncbi:hypothetical protein ERHA54_27020 [Erwinia rhapontici]|nr:hypothetical protein ERHA54_27020 [Erwinia rhapontici]